MDIQIADAERKRGKILDEIKRMTEYRKEWKKWAYENL